jgi:pimeloyl-ACP methyl ester carboxylesterase
MASGAGRNGVNAITAGHGSPVILIHGLAASLFDWEAITPALVGAGYRSYALDLLGHGDSVKPAGAASYHIEAVYAHFEGWVSSLGLEHPAALVGHSLGGYLSLAYALRHPRKVAGLALIDPFYSLQQLAPVTRVFSRQPALGAKAMRLAPEWLIDAMLRLERADAVHIAPTARRQIVLDYKRASPYVLHIPRTASDLTPRLPDVAVPALVLWGDRDLTLAPQSFPPLVAKLPQARGQMLPGSGHQPHIARPAEVSRMLLEFFATRPTG